MEKVRCINCGSAVAIDISRALDENGEEFRCPHCGFVFRYAKR
jgi:DNA-directed RNA polymerase subunit RPC12/RpoP